MNKNNAAYTIDAEIVKKDDKDVLTGTLTCECKKPTCGKAFWVQIASIIASALIALAAVIGFICLVFIGAGTLNELITAVCGLGAVAITAIVCFTALCVICVRVWTAAVKADKDSPKALKDLLRDYCGKKKDEQ